VDTFELFQLHRIIESKIGLGMTLHYSLIMAQNVANSPEQALRNQATRLILESQRPLTQKDLKTLINRDLTEHIDPDVRLECRMARGVKNKSDALNKGGFFDPFVKLVHIQSKKVAFWKKGELYDKGIWTDDLSRASRPVAPRPNDVVHLDLGSQSQFEWIEGIARPRDQ
jgi:hypothetical protein